MVQTIPVPHADLSMVRGHVSTLSNFRGLVVRSFFRVRPHLYLPHFLAMVRFYLKVIQIQGLVESSLG